MNKEQMESSKEAHMQHKARQILDAARARGKEVVKIGSGLKDIEFKTKEYIKQELPAVKEEYLPIESPEAVFELAKFLRKGEKNAEWIIREFDLTEQ